MALSYIQHKLFDWNKNHKKRINEKKKKQRKKKKHHFYKKPMKKMTC